MPIRVDGENWGPGPNIMADDTLAALRAALGETAVLVEHRFYRGSSAPQRFVVDSFDPLLAYLREKTRPGDAIWLWRFDELCRDENPLTHGKIPDEEGLVPAGGPY